MLEASALAKRAPGNPGADRPSSTTFPGSPLLWGSPGSSLPWHPVITTRPSPLPHSHLWEEPPQVGSECRPSHLGAQEETRQRPPQQRCVRAAQSEVMLTHQAWGALGSPHPNALGAWARGVGRASSNCPIRAGPAGLLYLQGPLSPHVPAVELRVHSASQTSGFSSVMEQNHSREPTELL